MIKHKRNWFEKLFVNTVTLDEFLEQFGMSIDIIDDYSGHKHYGTFDKIKGDLYLKATRLILVSGKHLDWCGRTYKYEFGDPGYYDLKDIKIAYKNSLDIIDTITNYDYIIEGAERDNSISFGFEQYIVPANSKKKRIDSWKIIL